MPDSILLRGGVVFGTRERLVNPATHPSGRQAGTTTNDGGPEPWETRFRVNRWWVEDDSVRIKFSGQARDWNVALGLSEEGLGGQATHGDENGASVSARRISCAIG